MPAIITLTSDFGYEDPFVGIMKGVILSIAPEVTIVDLCHGLPPQDIVAGALALESAVGCFPVGTVHLGVVDPGVGSERAAIAIQTERGFYVGPDNGLFSLALDRDRKIRAIRLTNMEYHAATISSTFHGRDIFAPVAAHLASGVSFESIGDPIEEVTALDSPAAAIDEESIGAAIIHADRYGNLITNLRVEQLDEWLGETGRSDVSIEVGDERPIGLTRTFSDGHVGETVVYIGSGGRLEIGVRNRSAVDRYGRAARITIRRQLGTRIHD